MEYITDKSALDSYIETYKIKDFFSDQFFKQYYKYMALTKFAKNEYVFYERGNIHYIYIFLNGKVKVCALLSNGKQQLLNLVTGTCVMGDLELFGIDNPFVTVQAIKETLAISIPLEFTRNYLDQDSVFLKKVGKLLAQKIYIFTSNTALNMNYQLKDRLCSYISFVSKEITVEEHEYLYFNESLSDTADLLGTSYRHLQRILKDLQEESILTKHGKGYLVTDINKLMDLSSDEFIIET